MVLATNPEILEQAEIQIEAARRRARSSARRENVIGASPRARRALSACSCNTRRCRDAPVFNGTPPSVVTASTIVSAPRACAIAAMSWTGLTTPVDVSPCTMPTISAGCGERALHLRGIAGTSPLDLHAGNGGAIALEHLRQPIAEVPGDHDERAGAGLCEVRDRRFHPGRPRARRWPGSARPRRRRTPTPSRVPHVVEQRDHRGIEMADHRRSKCLHDTRRDRARTRSEQQSFRHLHTTSNTRASSARICSRASPVQAPAGRADRHLCIRRDRAPLSIRALRNPDVTKPRQRRHLLSAADARRHAVPRGPPSGAADTSRARPPQWQGCRPRHRGRDPNRRRSRCPPAWKTTCGATSTNCANCAASVPDSFMPTIFVCSARRATLSAEKATPVDAGKVVQQDRDRRRVRDRGVMSHEQRRRRHRFEKRWRANQCRVSTERRGALGRRNRVASRFTSGSRDQYPIAGTLSRTAREHLIRFVRRRASPTRRWSRARRYRRGRRSSTCSTLNAMAPVSTSPSRNGVGIGGNTESKRIPRWSVPQKKNRKRDSARFRFGPLRTFVEWRRGPEPGLGRSRGPMPRAAPSQARGARLTCALPETPA